MGNLMCRRNPDVEEVEISSHNAYKYPPKSGNYFGGHFIMGGERFDTIQPEAYLFGENQDLNFLGSRPIPFPYPAPQCHEPTKTLRSLVNIRKDSLRFIKVQENENNADRDSGDVENGASTKYNIEFTFDTDVRCAITIYYFATEEFLNGQMVYHPQNPSMNSETFHYKRGANQTFSQTTHVIDPSTFPDHKWLYNPEKDTFPIVIRCSVEEEDCIGHAHITFGYVEKNSENAYILKPLKQKQVVDGLCYLLQEIYGIENKNAERKVNHDDDFEDNGSECVICMSDTRDTLILPCRHLCLCNGCANNLRYQANNCPICRAPFRALLQIRALRRKLPNSLHQPSDDETPVSQEGVPNGYEAVALIEALNGPTHPAPLPNPLQMPAEGLPPPTRPSMLNSPHESPVLEKSRKTMKRQPSVGNRSLREVVVPEVEEAEEAKEHAEGDVEQGRGTPEVVIFAQAPDPVKSEENLHAEAIPTIRYSGTKKRASPEGDDPLLSESEDLEAEDRTPKVEVINETARLSKENLLYSNCRQGTQETTVSESTSDSEECEMHEALAVTPEASSQSPEQDDSLSDADSLAGLEEEEDDVIDDDDIKPMNAFRQAAHTKVLYEREDDVDMEHLEQESLVIGLQHDTMSLPGTPSAADGSSGSSYGSTSSTRMLLPSTIKPDEDEVQTYKPANCV